MSFPSQLPTETLIVAEVMSSKAHKWHTPAKSLLASLKESPEEFWATFPVQSSHQDSSRKMGLLVPVKSHETNCLEMEAPRGRETKESEQWGVGTASREPYTLHYRVRWGLPLWENSLDVLKTHSLTRLSSRQRSHTTWSPQSCHIATIEIEMTFLRMMSITLLKCLPWQQAEWGRSILGTLGRERGYSWNQNLATSGAQCDF